jgi:hypothetical protein
MRRPSNFLIVCVLCCVPASTILNATLAQEDPKPGESESEFSDANLIPRAIARLLEMQEGDDNAAPAEWPYEGVYRVNRRIPIGYRVGGTAIVASALVLAPGLESDEKRLQAVHRATRFVADSINHSLMSHDFGDETYDVRGWGYAYGLQFLTLIKQRDLAPAELNQPIDDAIKFFIAGIESSAVPTHGGWNYARPAGFKAPAPPSPFMTGSTLQALFAAGALGYEINPSTVESALNMLQSARTEAGAFVYAGVQGDRSRDAVPGAVGRMLIGETTLHLAGRGDIKRIRGAIDAFIVHWDWLEKRRRQQGTHEPPYGIAPYYFYYAHYYAALAIEMLPRHERAEYRRRLHELLMRTYAADDGTWNDRVFERSASYGTAMAIMALMMPELPPPAAWQPDAVKNSDAQIAPQERKVRP